MLQLLQYTYCLPVCPLVVTAPLKLALLVKIVFTFASSSRSHLLFMLRVEGYDKVSRATSHGRLTLVDLAGSERISRSEATGIRLVEAAAINKSLSALGQVCCLSCRIARGLGYTGLAGWDRDMPWWF